MTGQQRLEALLRAARVYETHDMALAAPEVQQAIREMAPLVERDPVRELAMATVPEHGHGLMIGWSCEYARQCAARAAANAVAIAEAIDDELARLRTTRKPPIK